MIRASILALALASAAAPALGQPSIPPGQVAVYVDMDQAMALIRPLIKMTPPDLAADQAKITQLTASYNQQMADLQRKRDILTESQTIAAQRAIGDQEASIRRATMLMQDKIDDYRRNLDQAAGDKLRQAIKDYRQQNPYGVIVYHRSGDSIVVPSGVFEISDSLVEMVKSGPGAFAQANPRKAPVTVYVGRTRYLIAMGIQAEAQAQMTAVSAPVAAAKDVLRNRQAKLDKDAPSMPEIDLLKAKVGVLEAELAVDAAKDKAIEKQTSVQMIVDNGIARVSEYLTQHPTALAADVVIFVEDGIDIADPALDVTDKLVAIMKAAKD